MENCATNIDRHHAGVKLATFGSRLSELIVFLKVTKKTFALENGVSPQTVTNYCADVHEPKQRFVDLIVEKYGVNPEWLKKGLGDMFARDVAGCQSAQETTVHNYERECLRLQHELAAKDRETAAQVLETARLRDAMGRQQSLIFEAVVKACRAQGLTPEQTQALTFSVMDYENYLESDSGDIDRHSYQRLGTNKRGLVRPGGAPLRLIIGNDDAQVGRSSATLHIRPASSQSDEM